MSEDEAQVERVALAIFKDLYGDEDWSDFDEARKAVALSAARAAIAAMQSDPIPVYASRDATDEFVKGCEQPVTDLRGNPVPPIRKP